MVGSILKKHLFHEHLQYGVRFVLAPEHYVRPQVDGMLHLVGALAEQEYPPASGSYFVDSLLEVVFGANLLPNGQAASLGYAAFYAGFSPFFHVGEAGVEAAFVKSPTRIADLGLLCRSTGAEAPKQQ